MTDPKETPLSVEAPQEGIIKTEARFVIGKTVRSIPSTFLSILGPTDRPGQASAAQPHGPPGLPCHMSEQLNRDNTPTPTKGGATQRTKRLQVELEIQGLCVRYGVERIGFLTFTFSDDVKTIQEASRRFNSMNSHKLAGRYREWLSVVQRHKDNRIHFHLVVVMDHDIRTGFDFEAVKRRDYSSASAYLKAEWSFLRQTLPEYSFGRHELLPVRIAAGFGRYVARYVARAGNTRQDEKGARLVRFSKTFQRCVCGPFSKVDFIEERSRNRIPQIRSSLGYPSQTRLEADLGPRWRYHLARLMYCDQATFDAVTWRMEDALEIYGGRLLAIEESFAAWDAKAPEREKWAEHARLLAEYDEQREHVHKPLFAASAGF